jgi:hypothetical protein
MAVLQEGEGSRVLVGAGEAIYREGAKTPAAMVLAVRTVQLALGLMGAPGVHRVFPGRAVPGAPALRVCELVAVTGLEYRQRTIPRGARKTLDGEYCLAELAGSRGILQHDVDPPPSPLEMLARRLAAVRVAEVAPGTWEINADRLFETVRADEPVVWEALRSSGVGLSPGGGIGVEVTTPVMDARVDRQGFVIASPKLAERAGLRVQDRILSVNGIPIDRLGTLVTLYRQIRTSPDLKSVQVVVERDKTPLTLTCRHR